MLETWCYPTWLWNNAWFKIRQELLSLMTLCLTILNSSSTKGCIQFHSLDGSNSWFILYSLTVEVPSSNLIYVLNRRDDSLSTVEDSTTNLTCIFTKPIVDIMPQSTTSQGSCLCEYNIAKQTLSCWKWNHDKNIIWNRDDILSQQN